jgi:hypothetical protein
VSAKKSRRGFAAMDPEVHRAVSARGGRSAHAKGTGRKFTHEKAAVAGKKGGRAGHERGTAHEFTAEEARAAGSKGGRANVGDRPARVAEAAARQAAACVSGQGRLTPATLARRAEMAELWAAGLTLAQIGERFGVTRQAVGALRAVDGAAGGGER